MRAEVKLGNKVQFVRSPVNVMSDQWLGMTVYCIVSELHLTFWREVFTLLHEV